jgi:hypothetical protein
MNAGELTRRVTFQRRPLDDFSAAQPWEDGPTRSAKVMPLKGGEGVKQQRLAGEQPVVIVVRRDSGTRAIDNSWRAYDARRAAPDTEGALV